MTHQSRTMCFNSWLKRLICRRMITLVFFSYFIMIVVFILNSDFTEPESNTEESFALMFPEPIFNAKHESLTYFANNSYSEHRKPISMNDFAVYHSVLRGKNVFDLSGSIEMKIKFQEPIPLLEPMIDQKVKSRKAGDFIFLGDGAYVYSAFFDDRKEQSFIRIMSLISQKASDKLIYCHFYDVPGAQSQAAELYQLCENHNKFYGGYFYSCQVPHDIKTADKLTSIIISFTETGPKVKIPLQSVRPPDSKLTYLDLYPQAYSTRDNVNSKKDHGFNVPSVQDNTDNSPVEQEKSISRPPLSFAICVSPLFGNISVHRLVEFIELSRLLGAEHFIFYNHSVPQHISNVLLYYMSKNIASVMPWSFPSEVDSVWYFGQLLANNDCLYRTMPLFDIVSFNDIDEFIVPHSNASTWKEAFSSLLTEKHCGFSFQSAFYDPGIRETFESTLLTPVLTAKSGMYSKVRTKVMLCPWRVFEVGIHHISKQNREEWRPLGVHPSVAYLHHYRRCVANFGMRCSAWEKDFTIADRYLKNLSANYETELNNILFPQRN